MGFMMSKLDKGKNKKPIIKLTPKEKERLVKKESKDLDRELPDTFPASDPVNRY